ncbi:MAG: hypothetical protein ABH832_00090 [bacterium]
MNFLKFALFCASIILANIFFINAMPYPINEIKIVIFTMIWIILLSKKINIILWFILLVGLFQEASASTPFGAIFLAMLSTAVAVNWILKNIFTNRTLYTTIFSMAIGILFYNFVLILQIYFYGVFNGLEFSLFNSFLPTSIVIQILITSCFAILFFLITHRFAKKINPNYVK